MNQQLNDNTIMFSSPFSMCEDSAFLQDKIDFYHDQQEVDQPQQQGGDFKPTFYNPFEIKHRRRTSRAQFKVLEKTFLENPKPNAIVRRWLAQKLSMTPRGVQVWFQNRRAKEKTANIKKMDKKPQADIQEDTRQAYPMSAQHSVTPSSPEHSICLCQDCQPLFATPMSRTASYPPFYSSDGSTTADDEEFLMTPVTPFVDQQQQQQQQQFLYGTYPMFMNNDSQIKPNWVSPLPTWPAMMSEDPTSVAAAAFTYVNNNNNNNALMFDHRRYSSSFTPEAQPNELFRRLSEPIFDQNLNFFNQAQFNFLTRNTDFGAL
ncbi:hypothetical protein BD560DRAFT_365393 [Blakeslea trispora]|nr:hypothetical protein BD560DRAFT_365393 [Blakeslea trispora]